MLNIYLKVAIEKNWRSKNFGLLSLQNFPPVQFLGGSNSPKYNWIWKPVVASVLPKAFLGIPVHAFTVYFSGTEWPPSWLGGLQENFLELSF